jgi:uroporphyrinogen-III synthase
MDRIHGLLLLSPSGAYAAKPWIAKETCCLVQGPATAEALGSQFTRILESTESSAEGLWALLQSSFPDGGDFLMVSAERSRGYLEEVTRGTTWRIQPWVTHREAVTLPTPELPIVDAVLALSPLQAGLLAPLTAELLRFAWGESTAKAFEDAGQPAHDWCEPKISSLKEMLRRYHR